MLVILTQCVLKEFYRMCRYANVQISRKSIILFDTVSSSGSGIFLNLKLQIIKASIQTHSCWYTDFEVWKCRQKMDAQTEIMQSSLRYLEIKLSWRHKKGRGNGESGTRSLCFWTHWKNKEKTKNATCWKNKNHLSSSLMSLKHRWSVCETTTFLERVPWSVSVSDLSHYFFLLYTITFLGY